MKLKLKTGKELMDAIRVTSSFNVNSNVLLDATKDNFLNIISNSIGKRSYVSVACDSVLDTGEITLDGNVISLLKLTTAKNIELSSESNSLVIKSNKKSRKVDITVNTITNEEDINFKKLSGETLNIATSTVMSLLNKIKITPVLIGQENSVVYIIVKDDFIKFYLTDSYRIAYSESKYSNNQNSKFRLNYSEFIKALQIIKSYACSILLNENDFSIKFKGKGIKGKLNCNYSLTSSSSIKSIENLITKNNKYIIKFKTKKPITEIIESITSIKGQNLIFTLNRGIGLIESKTEDIIWKEQFAYVSKVKNEIKFAVSSDLLLDIISLVSDNAIFGITTNNILTIEYKDDFSSNRFYIPTIQV